MSRFAQGLFTIKNPNKYVGKHVPRYRSGWEHAFMTFCDNHPSVVQWASEAVHIPYQNPITGKKTQYIPDFFVLYKDKNNKVLAEIVEIKPKSQSMIESKTDYKTRQIIAVNWAKWEAARRWCSKQGLVFRVINEDSIFRNGKR